MKTLKQWYDSLSNSAQVWIENNCSAWFDKNQADYYRKPTEANDKDELRKLLISTENLEKYSDYANARVFASKFIMLLDYLSKNHPEIISEATKNNCAYQLITSGISKEAWKYLSESEKAAGYTTAYKRYDKMSLPTYLYLIKDYDDINIDFDVCEIPALVPEVIEIIGKDNARKIIAMSDAYRLSQMVKIGEANELFDEIFFCKSSKLSQKDKLEILSRLYSANSSLPSERTVEDFFKRIVAVDHSYLRYIYKIVKSYPAIAMKLYIEKKPDSELTGNESSSEQYRYNKELRKLFAIAHACVLKRVSKVKSSMVKEIAPLLKIYGYNWDDIYDAIYPEDAHLN